MISLTEEITNCSTYLEILREKNFPIQDLENWLETTGFCFSLSNMLPRNKRYLLPDLKFINCTYSQHTQQLFACDEYLSLYYPKINQLQAVVGAYVLYNNGYKKIECPLEVEDFEEIESILKRWT